MAEQHSSYTPNEIRFQRVNFPKFFHRRTIGRHGQTLAEYTLLLAYISLVAIQALESLAFITTKEYVFTNCTLIVGQMQSSTPDSQMSAVDDYLSDPTSWKNADASKIAAAVLDIHNSMHVTIYGS